MRAAYYHGKGVITAGESVPRKPGPDEVRIDVAYCGVCGSDVHIFEGAALADRVSIPQVIGHEMSGEIVEIGSEVRGWSVGDRVVVRPLDPCDDCPACKAGYSHICYKLNFMGVDTPGAFQRSWTVKSRTLHRLPDELPLDRAALIEPLSVACHDIRRGDLQAGEYAVVIGGGPIGILIALAAGYGGAKVLVSEVNPYRVNLAREMGLDVVNPNESDLNQAVLERTAGAWADVAFEVTGTAAGAAAMTQVVRARGRIVVVGVPAEPPRVDLARVFLRELNIHGARVYEPEDFDKAIRLAASGALPLDRLISARWPVTELQRAIEQIISGEELMKVLIDTRAE